MPEKTRAELAAWVSAYAVEASAADNVDAFVGHVDNAILALLPELADDPVLTSELHASTRSQFKAFLNLLERPHQETILPPQARDLALSIARRNLELGVLLKIYRVAAASVWQFFTAVAADVPDDGPDRTDVLIYLWDHAGTWINEAIEQLIQVYYDEREAALQGAYARRAETVYSILREDPVHADAATTELGHKLRATQTALVLWVGEENAADSVLPLTALADRIAAQLGAAGPLTLPVGRREIWTWLATTTDPDLGSLRELVSGQDPSNAVSVAVGRPASGIAGFRQSHREAVDAQRLAVSSGSGDLLTAYDEVELVCVVSGNEAAARVLVHRELGALAATDPALDRVRETVRLYLGYGANVDLTAAELIVHKNTIRYRLAQAEELIGHSLSERRTEIDLALRFLERHGCPDPG